jgi:integrase
MTRVQKLRLPPAPTRYLTDDERQRLLCACQQSHNRLLYPVVVLALATGARKMELVRSKYSCGLTVVIPQEPTESLSALDRRVRGAFRLP